MTDLTGFPLPTPPHRFHLGNRVVYVLEQAHGEVLEVSTTRGDLGLPYCRVKWDDGGTNGVRESSWVLMQHLWPEKGGES